MGEVSGESTAAAGALRFKCSSVAGPQVTAAHEDVLTDCRSVAQTESEANSHLSLLTQVVIVG